MKLALGLIALLSLTACVVPPVEPLDAFEIIQYDPIADNERRELYNRLAEPLIFP